VDVQFAREPLTIALWQEATPLLAAHYDEVAHFKHIKLAPDRDFYANCDATGHLRTYTARSGGALVGYGQYIVGFNPHYKHSFQASEDVIYIDRAHRGALGWRFITWTDDQLRLEGCQVVMRHIKVAHDYGRLLERIGYTAVDRIFARRLDGRHGRDDRALPRLHDRAESSATEGEEDPAGDAA